MPRNFDNGRKPICTSHSRRMGAFLYDVDVFDTTSTATDVRFCAAQVVNMVRLEAGRTVAVNAELQHQYGGTRDEAFSKIEAAMKEWAES
jgi:hypothetical protein